MKDIVGRIADGAIVGAGVTGALAAAPQVEKALNITDPFAAAAVDAGLGIVAGMLPLPGGFKSVGAGFVAGCFGRAVTLLLQKAGVLQ